MSYDLIMFRSEVRERCKTNKIDVGQILEEEPDTIPDFDQTERELIKKYLESHDYVIESEKSGTIKYRHKSRASVTATLWNNNLSFSASSESTSGQWELFETSIGIMDASYYKLTRFDFQDGRWD
jgi:hypothetical protein